MQQQNKAYIFAISAVLLWSTVATAFNIALQYVDYMQLLLFASGIATLIMLAIVALEGKLHLAFSSSPKELFQSAIRGFLNPFVYYLILIKAYDVLPAQEAMTLNYTWPIMLTLLSIPLLKQKLSKKGFIAVLVSFVGVLLIASGGDITNLKFTNIKGDLLVLFTAIIWALFWIVNLRSKQDESVKLLQSFFFGFLFTIPVVAIFSDFIIPTNEGLLAVTYIGFAEMGITFFFWLMALKLSKRTDQVSQLIYFSPFLSLIFISIFLNEEIQISTIYGLMFILGGILINKGERAPDSNREEKGEGD